MKSILWVEDEKDQFRTFSTPLKLEYSITRAIDYQDALSNIQNNNYDLYIIDIILPSGNKKIINKVELQKIKNTFYGFELVKKLRSEGDDTPIVIVSVVNEQHVVDGINKIDPSIPYICKYDHDIDEIKEIIKESIYN